MRMCGYARVSTDEERQLDSLEHQMEFFSDFAKQNGHHLVNVYTDATAIIGLKQNPPKRASL